MHVHRSNRVEVLVEALARVVARPLATPLTTETVVVQSRGMERWLSIRLAERFGVWAGARFPFPRAFVDEVLSLVLEQSDDADREEAFSRERLTFWIARLLSECASEPAFAPIARYLEKDVTGHQLLELAARIADLYDEYVAYRPEMVLRWQGRETSATDPTESEWQALLWRRLVDCLGDEHTASRSRRFFARWSALQSLPATLPERVSVFGVSSLPPVYLEVLDALSQRIEVHLFCFTPSREHVTEIRSRREIYRALRRAELTGREPADADSLLLAEGNPLLATFGRVDREFQQVLEAVSDYDEGGADLFVDPGTDCALHALQGDVLHLRHRGAGREVPPLALAANDHSISVHSCHSPSREVEVLRDQLRARFEADLTLSPQDVIVMAPDIEKYAPLIEATFGDGQRDDQGIPYSIADRSNRVASEVALAFRAVMKLLRGRFAASEVADLLQHRPIRDRFGIGVEELPQLTRWIGEVGIRWGVDAADRESHGQPSSEANTWRFGLHRLLLGYAMPGGDRELFAGALPYDDVEGGAADALGRLVEMCEQLFALRVALDQEQDLARWVPRLEQVLTGTIAVEPRLEWEMQTVRDAIRSLGERAASAGFVRPVPVEVVASLLDQSLDADRSARRFLAGGVTFCALLPMRSIPFRVVCLLGMNDGQFPRLQRRLGFDLMATRPRAGDRSVRDEDRFLFLEALLSAREQLIITYVGRSVQDNGVLPPSVVLGELLDVVEESFQTAGDASPQATLDFGPAPPGVVSQILVEHPLQPFSPAYFTDRPVSDADAGSSRQLFSYDEQAAKGAARLVTHADSHPPFVRQPLPDLGPEERASGISLEQLGAFFENPARSMLRTRLELFLEEHAEVLADREPLSLDALDRWALGTGLLEQTLEAVRDGAGPLVGERLEAVWTAVRARGVLPAGVAGRCYFDDLVPDVQALAEAIQRSAGGERLPPVQVQIDVEGTRVGGRLNLLWPAAQIRAGFSRVQAKHELRAWVDHLALQCLPPGDGLPRRTVVVGRDQEGDGARQVAFGALPAARARQLLGDLIELYYLGMRIPLPFFPATSRRYVEERTNRLRREPDDIAAAERRALRAARELYLPPDYSRQRGEAHDPYVARVFGAFDPVSHPPDDTSQLFPEPPPDGPSVPSFGDLARRVFEPLLAATEVIE